jgi:hypothetical protein
VLTISTVAREGLSANYENPVSRGLNYKILFTIVYKFTISTVAKEGLSANFENPLKIYLFS